MGKFGKPWSVTDLEKHLARNPEARVAAKVQPGVSLTKKSEGNKKVRNATKIEHDGVKYDSKLEFYLASELKKHGITYEFQKCFLLQEGFTYRGAKIRPMTLTVDFWLPQFDLIVDSKGWFTDTSTLKFKLLRKALKDMGEEPEICFPKSKKECYDLILKISKL